MTNQELLLAISDMMDRKLYGIDQRLDGIDQRFDGIDQKLQSVDDRLKRVELTQENDILPRLQNIEACYISTYKRYQSGVEQIDVMQSDIDLMKQVLKEHSEKLQMLA